MKIWPLAVTDDRKALAEQAVDLSEAGNSDDEKSANSLGTLLRRMREFENLIDELQRLRKKPQTDGSRVQRDMQNTRQQGGGGDGPRQACRALRLCFYITRGPEIKHRHFSAEGC